MAQAPDEASAAHARCDSIYTAAFADKEPRSGFQALQQRLRHAKVFHDEMADYMAALCEAEDAYVKHLQKLTKRLNNPAYIPLEFRPVYACLMDSVGQTAQCHTVYARQLQRQRDILHQAPMQGTWSSLQRHDDTMAPSVKELFSLEAQLAKDQKRVEQKRNNTSAQAKLAATQQAFKRAQETWRARVPTALEAYEIADFERLCMLRDAVKSAAKSQGELARGLYDTARATAQTAKGFDPLEDMMRFSGLPPLSAPNIRPDARASGVPLPSEFMHSRNDQRMSFMPPIEHPPGARSSMQHSQPPEVPASTQGHTSYEYATAPSESGYAPSTTDRTGENMAYTPADPGTEAVYAQTEDGANRAFHATEPVTQNVYAGMDNGSLGTHTYTRNEDAMVSQYAGTEEGTHANGLYGSYAPTTSGTETRPHTDSTFTAAEATETTEFVPRSDRRASFSAVDSYNSTALPTSVSVTEPPVHARTKHMSQMPFSWAPGSASEDTAEMARVREQLRQSARQPITASRRRDFRASSYETSDRGHSRLSFAHGQPIVSPLVGSQITSPLTDTWHDSPRTGTFATPSLVSHPRAAPVPHSPVPIQVHVCERIHAVWTSGQLASVMITGEVHLSVGAISATADGVRVFLRLKNTNGVTNVRASQPSCIPSADTGVYEVDLLGSADVRALEYEVPLAEHDFEKYVPVLLQMQWRCEPQQSSVLLMHRSNAAMPLRAPLENLAFSLTLPNEPAVTGGVRSEPVGEWDPSCYTFTWRSRAVDGRGAVRFPLASQGRPHAIAASWSIPTCTVSSFDVHVEASGTPLVLSPTTRTLQSGTYYIQP